MRLTTATTFLLATSALAFRPLTPDAIESEIVVENLRQTLQHLNRIAQSNGGTRAFGTPGYKASVDLVLERAQSRFSKKFTTYLQPFNTTFDQTLDIWVRGPDGEDVFVLSPLYNPATPLPGGITASLLDTPVKNDPAGPMCLPEHWEGIDATGKLVLVKRGVCAVSEKLKLAKSKGALGEFSSFLSLLPSPTVNGELVTDMTKALSSTTKTPAPTIRPSPSAPKTSAPSSPSASSRSSPHKPGSRASKPART